MRRLVQLIAACCLISGCSTIEDIFTSLPPNKIPGKRIAVLDSGSKSLEADSNVHGEITLPPMNNDFVWMQAGGTPSHNPQHLSLAEHPKLVWTANLGEGANDRLAFISQPIATENKVFALDALTSLSAFDLATGHRLWRQDLSPDDPTSDGSYGGGVAYDDGKIYVTTGFAEVIAVDGKDGTILWRHHLLVPARGAATVIGGRIYIVNLENETHALAIADGHEIWRQSGIGEATNFIGGASVAAEGNTVIAPYTSGELYALRTESGSVEWTGMLASIKRTDRVAQLSDIRGLPVINNGRVYAIGNSDSLAAIDLRSGKHLWDREIGGLQTPWLAGGFLYVLTNNETVACFEADTGHIRWVREMPQWVDPSDKDDRMSWFGPVLAGSTLYIVSSEGKLVRIAPLTGEILSEEELSDGVTIPPIVSGNTLLLATQEGTLLAYR